VRAAAGGFTTVLDIEHHSPTDSASRLIEKAKVSISQNLLQCRFSCGGISDSHEIDALAAAGAFSLKLYLPKPIAPSMSRMMKRLRDDRAAARVNTGNRSRGRSISYGKLLARGMALKN